MANGITLSYLDWSGFRIDWQNKVTIFLDPPAKAELPNDRPLLIFLSHGHPEHLAGVRAYLTWAGANAKATIFASAAICRYLLRFVVGHGIVFKSVQPGDHLHLDDDVSIDVFRWRHLPLLPSGVMPSLRHLAHLLSKPDLAAKIAWAGLMGPRADPMLGFHLALGGLEVLAYGEGLHRFCDEIAVGRGTLGTVVLAGVEPGDEAAMPGLIRASAASTAVFYEPHAKWRNAFGMPRVDLAAFKDSLGVNGITAHIAEPGRPELF